jgi:hypothetical protein
VHELVERFHQTREALGYLTAELQHQMGAVETAVRQREAATNEAVQVSKHARKSVQAAEEDARHQRELLVRAALRSLQQMRGHVAKYAADGPDALSGLPQVAASASPPPPSPSRGPTNSAEVGWSRHKHRWGIVSAGNGDTTIVSFEAVRPRAAQPCHSQPPTNSRADSTAGSTRSTHAASRVPASLTLPTPRPPPSAANSIRAQSARASRRADRGQLDLYGRPMTPQGPPQSGTPFSDALALAEQRRQQRAAAAATPTAKPEDDEGGGMVGTRAGTYTAV